MKLTNGGVVTIEMKEWGQHLQSLQIPSSSQETHQNMLGRMYIEAQLLNFDLQNKY